MSECFLGGAGGSAIDTDKLVSAQLANTGGITYKEFTDEELSDGKTRLVVTASNSVVKTADFYVLIKNKTIADTNITGVSLDYIHITDYLDYWAWRLTGLQSYQTVLLFE